MEPIRHVLTVASSAADAFEVFTGEMGAWWDPAYSPEPAAYAGIAIDPRVGGAVEMLAGTTRVQVGTVTAWEPGVRFAQTFVLARHPAYPSTIEVAFEEVDQVCEVTFEHGGWHAENGPARARYGDWPHLLGRYAAACARRE
jgi:hypothetical protein